jgi:hypothetical protein
MKTRVVSSGGVSVTIGQPSVRSTRDLDEADKSTDIKLAEAIEAYILSAMGRSGIVQDGIDLLSLNIQELMDLFRQTREFTYAKDDPDQGKAPSP